MGRLELLIPFTEVVVVQEDRRRGLLRVVVEGEEYPRWQLGCEVMAVRIDKGSSLVGIGQELERIEKARIEQSTRPNLLIPGTEKLDSGEVGNVMTKIKGANRLPPAHPMGASRTVRKFSTPVRIGYKGGEKK